MATTIKRPVARLNQGEQNLSRYLNQMVFKGIVLNNNPYDVDQLSLKTAKNVCVDENGTLISRPPIKISQLPNVYSVYNDITTRVNILDPSQVLVDFYDTGKVLLYVGKNGLEYGITAVDKNGYEVNRISGFTKYHVSVLEQYIIVFNDVNGVALDINNFNLGWQSLNDISEIPVTKRIVGQESISYPLNQFTEDRKEEYVISDVLLMSLPEGTAEAEVSQSPDNLKWTLENANINTEFRVLRGVNAQLFESDIITVAVNVNTGIDVLAIARPNHVMISLDSGQSFERVLYPIHAGFSYVASVSKDGLFFFFVARDGVYRYSTTKREWVVIRLDGATLEGNGISNACCFLNSETFTFALHFVDEGVNKTHVYWKGPSLEDATHDANTLGRTEFLNKVFPETKTAKTYRDCTSMDISVRTEDTNQIATVVAFLPGQYETTLTGIVLSGLFEDDMKVYDILLDNEYCNIISSAAILSSTIIGVEVVCIASYNQSWVNCKIEFGQTYPVGLDPVPHFNFDPSDVVAYDPTDEGAPVYLMSGHLIDKNAHSVDGIAALPVELNTAVRQQTVAFGGYFYIVLDNKLYTNKLTVADSSKLVYTYRANQPFTKVPTVSYSGQELFIGFDNILMITDNVRDNGQLRLNLPTLNNHSFSSNLNALVNISTTQVAAFLSNKVFIITKVEDDVFGFRYDYLPTRLSAGVRLGDVAFNTMNGMSTLYPTAQGLALMNYQPDVNTTDQASEYVSNNILAIWREFYKAGPIKILQMRDYIYLSNGTTEYLMLDLRGMTWWSFTSPFPVSKIVTDQFNFYIVSNGLYEYDYESSIYLDVNDRNIDWIVESQPNHFNAPVYYKNLKQIIFQLEESNIVEQTIAIQIKLYRKNFSTNEPETIGFKIDSYRTFIKRFNYWKINEMQWVLASDPNSGNPVQLKLNGLSIKYEISEEVRS